MFTKTVDNSFFIAFDQNTRRLHVFKSEAAPGTRILTFRHRKVNVLNDVHNFMINIGLHVMTDDGLYLLAKGETHKVADKSTEGVFFSTLNFIVVKQGHKIVNIPRPDNQHTAMPFFDEVIKEYEEERQQEITLAREISPLSTLNQSEVYSGKLTENTCLALDKNHHLVMMELNDFNLPTSMKTVSSRPVNRYFSTKSIRGTRVLVAVHPDNKSGIVFHGKESKPFTLDSEIKKLTGIQENIYILDTNGNVYSTGTNSDGLLGISPKRQKELGIEARDSTTDLIKVPVPKKVKDVFTVGTTGIGEAATFFLTKDNELYGIGHKNVFNTSRSITVPREIPLKENVGDIDSIQLIGNKIFVFGSDGFTELIPDGNPMTDFTQTALIAYTGLLLQSGAPNSHKVTQSLVGRLC